MLSGQYSYSEFFGEVSKDFGKIKDDIKRRMGKGIVRIESLEQTLDLPKGKSYKKNNEFYFLESWGDYKDKSRRETVELLVAEMLEIGINIDKEIIEHEQEKLVSKAEKIIPIF